MKDYSMKALYTKRQRGGQLLVALVAMLALSTPAAAQYTWTGAFTTEWNFGLNWSPSGNNYPNSATAMATFGGQGLGTVNISPSVQAQSLTFSNPTGSYTLTSSAGQTLSGVTSINVAAGVNAVQTINLANVATGSLLTTPSGNLTITNNSTAAGTTLVIGPNTVIGAPGTDGGDTIFNGAGTTQISGSWSNAPGDNRVGSVIKNGTGTLILSNSQNNYQATQIYDGKVVLGAGTAIPSNSTVVVWGGELNIGSLSNTATTPIGTLELFDAGTFHVPSGSGDYYIGYLYMGGGTMNFAGTSNFWLHLQNSVRINSSSTTATWIGSGASRIQNDTSTPLSINVDPGTTPSGIDLDAGIILSSGTSGVSNPTFVKDGAGTMRLTNPLNSANINIVAGKLRVDDMANLGSGIITVNGGTLQYSGTGATTTKDLTTAGTARIQVSTPGANLNYNGVITQSSFTNLYVLGPGAGSAPSTLSLNNNSSYFFNTFVYDNAILAIPTINNAGNPSPIGTNLFSTGIVLGATDSRGTLLLTGIAPAYSTDRKATLSGLYFSGGGGAFGVPNANTELTWSGQVTGSGSLIKTGLGTVVLSNTSNNYSGGTYVDGGRLHVSNDAALGTAAVTINAGGILRYTDAATAGRSLILNGGALEVKGSLSLTATGALQGQGTVEGDVASAGYVIPEGSTGLLHVDGNYTQSSAGRLIIFSDLFLPPGNNSRLDVTGDIALNGTLQMNLNGMGRFRGTRSFDVLDWGGNLSGTFSTLQLPSFGGAFTWDTSQLYTSGVLTLTGPPLEGDYNNDGVTDAADYVVWRKTDGTQAGYDLWRAHFGAITGVANGAAAMAGLPSSAVPEPATAILLLLGFAIVGVSACGRSSWREHGPEFSSIREHQASVRIIQTLTAAALSGVLATVLCLAPATNATAKNWADGTANWSPGTWSPAGVPTTGEAVNIVFTDGVARTVTYNVASLSAGLLTVDLTGPGTMASALSMPNAGTLSASGIVIGGYNGINATLTAGRGAFTQSAGTTTVNSGWDFTLGYGANSTGTYTLSGTGALIANQSEYVGLYGNGTFTHSAGTNTIATATGFFDIGTFAGSSGTYNLSGSGALVANTSEYVGYSGTGIFNQSGGTNTMNIFGFFLDIGAYAGSTGTYNLSGTGTLTATNEYIGDIGTGVFNQTGGTNSIGNGYLYIGFNASGAGGTYNLSGGTLSPGNNQEEFVGRAGSGSFNQSGGTNGTIIDLYLGALAGSTGTYTLSGTGVLIDDHAKVGSSGTGIFNQTGGTNNTNDVTLGDLAGSTGTYTLSAGSLTSSNYQRVGYNGPGTFNQSGGTNTTGDLVVGVGAIGAYNLSGGSATVSGYAYIGGSISGPGGTGVLTVSGTGVLTDNATLVAYNTSGSAVNLTGGTINTAALNFNGNPALLNWTSGKLNLTSNVVWDSTAAATSTSAAFGAARTLGSGQTLMITGNETLGGTGAFALTLNSGGTHNVTGGITLSPTGTLTQNAGSTLTYSTFTQAGGTVNGTLQNQTSFTYQSGLFNGRLWNQGTVSFGSSFTVGNGVQNDANMTINIGQTLTVNGAGLDNESSFSLAGGTLNGDGPLANNSVLTGRGTLAGAGGFANNGYLAVSGGTLAISNTGFNSNAGQIDVPGGQQLQLTGASLTNTGAVYLTGGTVSGTATLNNTTGIISGHGTIASPLTQAGLLSVDSGILNVATAFSNSGEIYLAGGVATLSGSGTLTNAGLLRGDGVVNKQVNNNVPGEIRAESGKRIKLTGVNGNNVGLVNLQGGTAEFSQALFNGGTGQIVGRGTLKVGGTGLQNNGNVALSSGITDIFGNVNNSSGSATKGITISGNADVTFWDDVTNGVGSLFKVSSGSSATFFGTFGGAGISGTGNTYFESDISPGFSPASVDFGGNVSLDSTSNLKIELGGTSPGSQFDQVHVAAQLSLGGTLQVALINGFSPSSGQSFDILDWGSLAGTFSALQLPTLAGGLVWNTSQLYTAGVLSVGLPGDFNFNGIVDAADYVVWRKGLGTTYTQNDYNVWRANFGATAGSGATAGLPSSAVPEPAALLIAGIGFAVVLFQRRRCQHRRRLGEAHIGILR
jgi:autotransporter-associated beta strand protein